MVPCFRSIIVNYTSLFNFFPSQHVKISHFVFIISKKLFNYYYSYQSITYLHMAKESNVHNKNKSMSSVSDARK